MTANTTRRIINSNRFQSSGLLSLLYGTTRPLEKTSLRQLLLLTAFWVTVYVALFVVLHLPGASFIFVVFTFVGWFIGFQGHKHRRMSVLKRMLVISAIPIALALIFWYMSAPQVPAKYAGFLIIPAAGLGVIVSTFIENGLGAAPKTLQRLWQGTNYVGVDGDIVFSVTPLTERLSRSEIRGELPLALQRFQNQPVRPFPVFTVLSWVAGFALFLFVFYGVIGELRAGTDQMWSQLLGMSAVMSLLGYATLMFVFFGIVERRLPQKRDLVRLANFIDVNHFDGPNTCVDPTTGTSFTNMLRSTQPFPYFVANTINRSALNVYGTQFAGRCEIVTSTPLPNMRLLSQKKRPNWFNSVEQPAPDQHLSLEGDFDSHFRLFCPTGYERDALYLFTPDVLADLVDDIDGFDIELIDHRIVIHSRGPMVTLDPLQWLRLAQATTVLQRRVDAWSRWRDERLDQGAMMFAPLRTAAKGVATKGRRLRGSVFNLIIIGALFWATFITLALSSHLL